jgi:NAD+-dependent farnesol dehydrogenase
MSILITGSTGFIGANLAMALANQGHKVHALYRSEKKAEALQHKNIVLCKGDILDKDSLKKAMAGCSQVYHIAAFTDVWTKYPSLIHDLNVTGTLNVYDTALELGAKDIVFTSTAGVLGPSLNEVVNENTEHAMGYFLEYERTKALAEEKTKAYVTKGLNIRIVNPTRVYGPGLLSKSNSVTIMIHSYAKGKWRLIPGNGKSIGNYVFVASVVQGHILAMEKGKTGERYLLGGDNVSYLDFFKTLKKLTGRSHMMVKVPLPVMLAMAYSAMFINKVLGVKPFITPALVRKFNYDWEISSEKAVKELGFPIVSIEQGMQKTLDWIKKEQVS